MLHADTIWINHRDDECELSIYLKLKNETPQGHPTLYGAYGEYFGERWECYHDDVRVRVRVIQFYL